MPTKISRLLVILSALLVIACNNVIEATLSPKPINTQTTSTSKEQIDHAIEEALKNLVLSGRSDGAQSGCSPHEIARFVLSFIETFNYGDQKQLVEFFEENFTGYGMSADSYARRFRTTMRSELLTYFKQRHQQSEQLQLVILRIHGWDQPHRLVHIEFTLKLRADDYPPSAITQEHIAEGKGTIKCEEDKRTIDFWGMGLTV